MPKNAEKCPKITRFFPIFPEFCTFFILFQKVTFCLKCMYYVLTLIIAKNRNLTKMENLEISGKIGKFREISGEFSGIFGNFRKFPFFQKKKGQISTRVKVQSSKLQNFGHFRRVGKIFRRRNFPEISRNFTPPHAPSVKIAPLGIFDLILFYTLFCAPKISGKFREISGNFGKFRESQKSDFCPFFVNFSSLRGKISSNLMLNTHFSQTT